MALKVLISGGGTGGHIYPAISIANKLKEMLPSAEVLFVGASGKMEMEKVPKAGYDIVGLPIRGFQRGKYLQNISALVRLFFSLIKAFFVFIKYRPAIVIGVGGYASGAISFIAWIMRTPIVIQEQNSYPGITNKLLAKKAKRICVAYHGMEKFFPKEKVVLTGNPVRKTIFDAVNVEKAYSHFGLDSNKKTVLILGGSLGARSMNNAVIKNLSNIEANKDIQFLWQCGSLYSESVKSRIDKMPENLFLVSFIDNMNYAYKIADLVVSRSGAGTISELTLLGKATIFVPSPNVAEDHQTKNAIALVENKAAEMIKDKDVAEMLINKAVELIHNPEYLAQLEKNSLKLALEDADELIVNEVLSVLKIK